MQTLHNYRPLCPKGVCFRGNSRCVECIERRSTVPALRHACYRSSIAATAAVSAMVWTHRAMGTWQTKVDAYIAPSELARSIFVEGGFPASRIIVKPHFIDPDPGIGSGEGGYAIYVGRLSREKGVDVLLDAWSELRPQIPLVIAGDGPLADDVARAARCCPAVRWLGRVPQSEVQRLVGGALCLIFPSVWYKTFGQVIGEAFAAGTPVVASADGAGAELVEHERTGMLARPGSASDIAALVAWLLAHPERRPAMRAAARRVYQTRLTADANYRQLIDIYSRAVDGRRALELSA